MFLFWICLPHQAWFIAGVPSAVIRKATRNLIGITYSQETWLPLQYFTFSLWDLWSRCNIRLACIMGGNSYGINISVFRNIGGWVVQQIFLNMFQLFSEELCHCHVQGNPGLTLSVHFHDDVIKWKHFPRNWPFVREIHRSQWIPHTKASDAELWCFLWSASE